MLLVRSTAQWQRNPRVRHMSSRMILKWEREWLSQTLKHIEEDMSQGDTTMQEEEFRRNCELRAKDEPVTNQQAIEALDHIVKNPRRDAEDTRTLNQAVSVLENFIYIHAGTESLGGPRLAERKTSDTSAGWP